MNPPILTAVIPCYNFQKYIEAAVDSILSQNTNFSFQIYLIDDCSSDDTFRIINEKYGATPIVSIFQSKKNQGITRNLADIFYKITTPYIFVIDGDDYLIDNSYFQRAIDFLENNKSFSMYCTGYKWLHNDGSFSPVDHHFVSNIEDIKFEDILSTNHISMGRVFRNYKNIVKSWMNDGFHEDWLINSEILKHGPARSEKCFGAVYRITNSGRITSLTNEQIQEKNQKTIQAIKNRMINKTITIVDSFVHNDNISKKLKNALEWMCQDGHDVLLVSNTVVDKDTLKNVKFYLYDHRNQLFKEKYEIGNIVDFWKSIGPGFMLHDIVPETQPHGLSVLVNLFNALLYAKAQGYTHFQRFEVDDLFGEKSREYIKKIPDLCAEQNKKGLFYYNTNDISFHYFYCEIDTFLNKVPRISSEQDYIDYLKKYHNNKVFKIVEVFVYKNLKRTGDAELLIASGDDMNQHFPDTHWNTETSVSSFDKKYKGCTSKIYYINEYNKDTDSYERTNKYILFTYSYVSHLVKRTIRVKKINGEVIELYHNTHNAGGWCMNDLPEDTQSISVYENNELLYEENVADCISYISIKK